MSFCSAGSSIRQSLGDLSNQLLLLLTTAYHNQPSIRSTGILRCVGVSGKTRASGVEVVFDEVYGVFLVGFVLSRPHPGLAILTQRIVLSQEHYLRTYKALRN